MPQTCQATLLPASAELLCRQSQQRTAVCGAGPGSFAGRSAGLCRWSPWSLCSRRRSSSAQANASAFSLDSPPSNSAIAARSSQASRSNGTRLGSLNGEISFDNVTDVTDVQGTNCAGFLVTSGVSGAVTDVTARHSNRASNPSSPMVATQPVSQDGIQAHQPPTDALRFGAFAAGVRLR